MLEMMYMRLDEGGTALRGRGNVTMEAADTKKFLKSVSAIAVKMEARRLDRFQLEKEARSTTSSYFCFFSVFVFVFFFFFFSLSLSFSLGGGGVVTPRWLHQRARRGSHRGGGHISEPRRALM